VSDWYQQTLTPPDVVECRIRLGLVPERDHAQVMVEIFDPMTSVQIGAWSNPHVPLARWQQALEEAVQKAQEMVGDSIEPF
jgi:hypothetical protein